MKILKKKQRVFETKDTLSLNDLLKTNNMLLSFSKKNNKVMYLNKLYKIDIKGESKE